MVASFHFLCLLIALIPDSALADTKQAAGRGTQRPVIDYLTGPSPSNTPPIEVALDFFQRETVRTQRLAGGAALAFREEDYEVESHYTTPRTGITHVLLRQRVNQIRVWNGDYAVHVTRDGRILNAHDRFARARHSLPLASPALTPSEALLRAAQELELEMDGPPLQLEQRDDAGREFLFAPGGISLESVPISLMYVRLDNGALRLAWNIVIREVSRRHWWELNLDAGTGELLTKSDWVANDSYRVFPYPVESPSSGVRQLVVDPADGVASPLAWHNRGDGSGELLETLGNNATVFLDLGNAPFWPSGGAAHDFDFALDLDGVSLDAMITNAFYWVNWNHDLFYHYGFDEAAGNFQVSNFGKGGSGGDPVGTFVHDGQVGENAIFATPPDGSSVAMVLGIFTADPTSMTIQSPLALAGTYGARPAEFGPALSELGIEGTIAAAIDVVEGPDHTNTDACSTILNSEEVAGKIALVDRGICLFIVKVANAQAAGAIGVIVANNVPGIIAGMSGVDPAIQIPSVLITREHGNLLRANLGNAITAGLHSQDLPNRDAAFDNGIMIHEYGHGVSGRLTGGRLNSSCLDLAQSDAMAEGWSDFFAVSLLTGPADLAADARPIGTFALGQPLDGTGIRNFPYSSDLAISPVVYEDIGNTNFPHGAGEVWASALLEVFWNLIEAHGFDSDVTFGSGGNNIALELVIDALKLQPCNPSFLDGRDAILLADLNNNAAENHCSIWQGFAKRGMGLAADDGGGPSSLAVANDFSLPVECVPEASQGALSLAAVVCLAMLRRAGLRSVEGRSQLM